VGYSPVLSGRIVPDVSKYRNAAFISVRRPWKRRRHYDPSKCQEPLTSKTLEGSAASPWQPRIS